MELITSKEGLLYFFKEEGFLETLWIGWEGNGKDFSKAIANLIFEGWKELGEHKGYTSMDDIDQIRIEMTKFIGTSNQQSTSDSISTKYGDFDVSLNENIGKGVTESDVKRIVRSEIKNALKDYSKKRETDNHVTKEEVKKMIRKTIVNQYKYLWEKSAFFINNI